MSRKRTTEEFIKTAKEIHGDKYNYSKVIYKSKEDNVIIICPIHGEFEQKAKLHLKGSGCKKCSYIERGKKFQERFSKNKETFVERSNIIHNFKYTYENFEYVNALTPSYITCPIHGDWLQRPNDHLSGKGCPFCNESHLEKEINYLLMENNLFFIRQKRFEWLGKQSLDFYLPEYNIAIECQGKQHFGDGGWKDFDYKSLLERDYKKKKLCEENNINLFYYIEEKYNDNNILIYNNENTFYNKDVLFSKINKQINYRKFFICLLHKHNELNVENTFLLNLKKINQKIFIFEDEIKYKQNIIESKLNYLLHKTNTKIFARKCEIKSIDNKICEKFLNDNHIQGNTYSKINMGLFYNNELVSVMTFGNLRKNLGSTSKEGYYELLRFCNKLNTTVVGGASKLFKHFLKEYQPKEVISYCDRRWSEGNLYEMLGFEFSHNSKPNYFYVIGDKRENRFKYRKDILVKQGFDPNKSEHEIMLERGIYRIYDCGCKVYKYVNKER